MIRLILMLNGLILLPNMMINIFELNLQQFYTKYRIININDLLAIKNETKFLAIRIQTIFT